MFFYTKSAIILFRYCAAYLFKITYPLSNLNFSVGN
jgi:hypothetical protein